MASYNSSDVTDMIRSKRVFLGTYCPPSSSCGGGGGGNGETGPTGPPGANGKTVLNGVGPPSSTVGTPGDFYLDTSSYVMYGPKYSNYYQNWSDMAGSLYLGTPNIYNYAYLQNLPASNVVCNVNILPITNLNVQFAAYDNSNAPSSLVITNTSTNTSAQIVLDLSTKYSLVAGTTYNLEYTCVPGDTLMDLRFQNGGNTGQQVIWTNNPWFASESLVGPAGTDGLSGPTGPTGPVAGSDTQIIFNQSGLAGATGTFTFDYMSGTLNVSSLYVSNTTTMSGNLFMNLCNICNVGTEGFSKRIVGLAFSTPPLSTTVSGAYRYYVIGSDTTLLLDGTVSNVKYFAVGGGGGGGFNVGAGGGAGGLQTNDINLSGIVTLSQYNTGYITLCATSYSITVGSGGPGAVDEGNGQSGGNTTFSGTEFTTITALGGGGGGSYGPQPGVDGGCGGGGSFTNGAWLEQPDIEPGGAGSQGYSGGLGNTVTFITGGGGGIGSAGGDAGVVSGNGGSAMTYLDVSYGGGGGGGAGLVYPSGSGGGGGAGDGSFWDGSEVSVLPGEDALSNTGSGGGGGGNGGFGGAGGTGIFILGIPTVQATLSDERGLDLGTVKIDQYLNMSINSTSNIALNPSGGNVYVSGNIVPTLDNYYDLGATGVSWRHLYVGGGTVYIGGIAISSNTGTNTIEFTSTTGGGDIGIAGASGVMGPTGPTGLDGPTGPTGPTGPVAGINAQIIYNNSGVPAGNSALTFDQATGTLTASALTVTNATSMTGNLNMNLCNISNIGTATFQSNTIMRGTLTLNTSNIALGISAGITTQGNNAIAVGAFAGNSNQGSNCIAIGSNAGSANQSVGNTNSIAIGVQAGQTSQGASSVAIGYNSANASQGTFSVAVGNAAASISQGITCVAIGSLAGSNTQSVGAVAVGAAAGQITQGINSVALGYIAGYSNLGNNSVAIGYKAGETGQISNSIAINATGGALNPAVSGFHVAPVRSVTTTQNPILSYNPSSEVITGGALTTSYSGSVPGLTITGTDTAGGAGYMNFLRVTNTSSGVTNPTKTLRVNPTGGLELLNSAYTSNIFSIADNGTLYVGGGNAGGTVNNSATSNYISMNGQSHIYDDGNMHIHATSGTMWINTSGGQISLMSQQVGGGSVGTGLGIGTSSLTAYVTISGGKTYTIGGYGYLATIGAGTGAGTTATYSLAANNRIQAVEFDATSDERLKDISGAIAADDAIRFVQSVSGMYYSWKSDPSAGLRAGFIAQDMHRAGYDHLISTIPNATLSGHVDDDGFTHPEGIQLTLNYSSITPYHHEAIKYLLAKVEALERTISNLMSSR
jgi:hypothetical protein